MRLGERSAAVFPARSPPDAESLVSPSSSSSSSSSSYSARTTSSSRFLVPRFQKEGEAGATQAEGRGDGDGESKAEKFFRISCVGFPFEGTIKRRGDFSRLLN